VDELRQLLGVSEYTMCWFDYGAPVGYRLALLHPERVSGHIATIQSGIDAGYASGWRSAGSKPTTPVLRQPHISANSTVRYFAGCGGYSQRSVTQQQPGHGSGGQGDHGRYT